MSTFLTTLITGSGFRRGGQAILSHLANETPLLLVPEPENEYDASAIKVLLKSLDDIPESEREVLEQELLNFGLSLEDLKAASEIHIGYVAASDGKPLKKSEYFPIGNREFALALASSGEVAEGRLGFSAEGKATVTIEARS